MGYQFAYDLGASVAGHPHLMRLKLEDAVRQHVFYNFYPPLPAAVIEPCVQAIEAYQDGEYDRIIETEFEHRIHGHQVPASAIVDACKLHGFVDALCVQTGMP